MKDLRATKLADLVMEKSGTATIFEKYKLDFCCKGNRTLEEACESQGVDTDEVVRKLESILWNSNESDEDTLKNMSLDQLVDHIVRTHHAYAKQTMPPLLLHARKVATSHGNQNPHLPDIAEIWAELVRELTDHMTKEEHVLFPYITRLTRAERTHDTSLFPRQPFINNPISIMEQEHDRAGELMREIRTLSEDYSIPEAYACTTYRLVMNEFREFEEDLHRHIHLENNVLFPKARKLETALMNR